MRTALIIVLAATLFMSNRTLQIPEAVNQQKWRVVRVVDREPVGFRPLGTGFILVRRGITFVVTNDHVAAKAKSSPSIFSIGTPTRESQLIARDEEHDLAILKINWPITDHGEIEDRAAIAKPGLLVYAYGFPDDAGSVADPVISSGTVFSVGRYAFIAKGIACRPGASGGPVFDAAGAIVGYVKGYYLSPDDCVCIPFQYVEDLIASNDLLQGHSIPRSKGSANTVGLLQCRVNNIVSDCTSAVTDGIGVATAVDAKLVEIRDRGVATITFASASPSAGWYACSAAMTERAYNIVVQAQRCPVGEQIGILTRGGTSIIEAPVVLQFK